jgi:hypothetical protein
MLEEVITKLRRLYNAQLEKPAKVLDVFVEQFGEPNVDSDIVTFDAFLEELSHLTMGNLGITSLAASNAYGHYSIDRGDYEANGRGKSILEYMPDLGMIDYLMPQLADKLHTLSTYKIIVHFPSVRVTNEYDKFVDIQDLYAKVLITPTGRMLERFELARTTYPYAHFKAGYAHSHLPRIGRSSAGQWNHPCLGSGPICATIATLEARYDINIWGLFAFELAKYVTVESIAGTPYIRLESIGSGGYSEFDQKFKYDTSFGKSSEYMMDKFIKHFAQQGKFKVKFVNGQYHLGESITSFCIRCSNEFIKWYNENSRKETGMVPMHLIYNEGILKNFIVSNGRIYNPNNYYGTSIRDAQDVEGNELFQFKGNMVKLHIIIDQSESNNEVMLFSSQTCAVIISKVLNIVNYEYAKRNKQKRKGSPNGPCEKLYIV